MSKMIYPSSTVAPSIDTIFINSIKFDICEVCEEAYDMLYTSKSRFFVVVEDNHIINYESAEKFCKKTGEVRWDLFCKTKSECKSQVEKFSEYYDRIAKLLEKAENKPGFKDSTRKSCISQANSIRETCMNMYGTFPI